MLIDSSRAHQLPEVLRDKLLAHVLDINFRGAGLPGFRLQARQGSAQAKMDATAEGDVTIGLALNVEAIRIGELSLVSVGRADIGHDKLIRPDTLITKHRLGCRNAHHRLHRRVIAEGLLDGTRHQCAIRAQALHYVGMCCLNQLNSFSRLI